MKKVISIFLGGTILLSVLCAPVLVKATDTLSEQELIKKLQGQIEQLKAQIEALIIQIDALRQARMEIKETAKEIKGTLKLIRHLNYGMRGDDVKLLQEMLATDPDIYPEGLTTGYFGPLTRNAVKRFQKVAGIEQVGIVGPKTTAKINEILKEGAGKSGKVPPGLLIAPGIRKKLGFAPQPLPGQELPPGISKKLGEGDTTPPVISEVTATDITATSTMVTWLTDEEADSKVWYDTSTPLVITGSTPTESSSDLVLNHEVELFSLTPSTTYYFIVSSTDSALNTTSSAEEAFNTLSE